MLDENGRRWTRRVRAGVKPLSRDGARVAFQELEAIAGVKHAPEQPQPPGSANGSEAAAAIDPDALVAALSPAERAQLAAKINTQRVRQRVRRKKRPDPLGSGRLEIVLAQ